MRQSSKTLELRFERTIPASPREVYDAWLNPEIPGTLWSVADKLLLNPSVDGFFYLNVSDIPHYGRFTEMERPERIEHTFVSPNTLGEESTVKVTFRKRGEGTLMTLVHSNLPATSEGRAHEAGWNSFLDTFPAQFADASRRKKKEPAD